MVEIIESLRTERNAMNIKILRRVSADDKPYWQTFSYERTSGDQTIAGLLDELNYNDDLKDITGQAAPRIKWECSCLQGMCGACSMVINGRPALACETFLRDIKSDTIVLEPLRKFPVIADLVVDRTVIQELLEKANAYIEEYSDAAPNEYEHMYLSGRCLKCGLCLEVCPNYKNGEKFYGATFANDCYLISSRSGSQSDNIRGSYKDHFEKGCSKSLSCADVCPINIPLLSTISKMNQK